MNPPHSTQDDTETTIFGTTGSNFSMPYFLRHWLFEYVGEPACEGGDRCVKTSQEALRKGIQKAASQITDMRLQVNALDNADDLLRWVMETHHTHTGPDDSQMADTSIDEILAVYPQATADIQQILAALSEGTVQRDGQHWLCSPVFDWLYDTHSTRRVMFASAFARQHAAERRDSASRIGEMKTFLMRCAEAKAGRITLVDRRPQHQPN